MPSLTLTWFDNLIFAAMLLLSALIGIYFGCFATTQSTATEYLLPDKKMKIFPISVSIDHCYQMNQTNSRRVLTETFLATFPVLLF